MSDIDPAQEYHLCVDEFERQELERDAELDRLSLVHVEVSNVGPWKIEPHNDGIAKRFAVTNSDTGLTLYVDYDDVNHVEVDEQIADLVYMLNVETFLKTYQRS